MSIIQTDTFFLPTGMHIQVVLLALAALASSQDPFGMELYVMEEVVCDLLRRHPVYRELSLKNVDECHYVIQQFGQDLCVRDPLNFSGSIYGTCFSLHTLRSMLSLKHPKTTTKTSVRIGPKRSDQHQQGPQCNNIVTDHHR